MRIRSRLSRARCAIIAYAMWQLCVSLSCSPSPALGVRVYSFNLGLIERPTTNDDGFPLCRNSQDCDLLESFSCTSLDGPFCSIASPKSSTVDLSKVLGTCTLGSVTVFVQQIRPFFLSSLVSLTGRLLDALKLRRSSGSVPLQDSLTSPTSMTTSPDSSPDSAKDPTTEAS